MATSILAHATDRVADLMQQKLYTIAPETGAHPQANAPTSKPSDTAGNPMYCPKTLL